MHASDDSGRPVRAALVLLVALALPGGLAAQGLQAVVGATLIDGRGGSPVPDAVVLVRGGRIACAGPRSGCRIPAAAQRLDARGLWVIPGLIDAHVHFSQTGWFDGRPDAADLRDRSPYPRVVAQLEADPGRYFRAYLCSGVTSVFDVGGYPWTWALRERFRDDPHAPRIAAAGPLLSSVEWWINLPGQQQFIYMTSDSAVREAVRTNAAFKSDAVKVLYIMPPQPPDTARIQALVRAAADEARLQGLPLIVHATGLWEAKDAIRAGARVLVHSVFESAVDDEFISLARDNHTIYVTTLTMVEGYLEASLGKVDGSRYPLSCADSASLSWARSGPPPEERLAVWLRRPGSPARVRQWLEVGMANAKRLSDAGISVAVGTDAGNPGTFHGPSIYREMELLQDAGLTPMQVLVAATRVAAAAMGREDQVGTVEAGKAADLLVLGMDPTKDIRNVQRIRWVMKGGVLDRR